MTALEAAIASATEEIEKTQEKWMRLSLKARVHLVTVDPK